MGLIGWQSLKVLPSELRLHCTLQTGQSFRWWQTSKEVYTGVIGTRVFQLRQTPDDILYRRLNETKDSVVEFSDERVLQQYFNLEECKLADLVQEWSQKDTRFAKVAPFLKGARVLRQEPLECLFQFICSSNNHIIRIQRMVETLCQSYGDLLWPLEPQRPTTKEDLMPSASFYAFPRIDQMKDIKEEELRTNGFGYRAKYVTNCVHELLQKDNGGDKWMQSLRHVSYEDALHQLCKLPGVGPKVAACVCLFSLDKHNAIPVDTHVHQLAIKYYQPDLQGKSLTKKVMKEIEARFQDLFGDYAGWAHNVLFVAELASHQEYLPEELRQTKSTNKASRTKRKRT